MINAWPIEGTHLIYFQDNKFESQAFEELGIPNPSSLFIILMLDWSLRCMYFLSQGLVKVPLISSKR